MSAICSGLEIVVVMGVYKWKGRGATKGATGAGSVVGEPSFYTWLGQVVNLSQIGYRLSMHKFGSGIGQSTQHRAALWKD
jgi:hypothetical protein